MLKVDIKEMGDNKMLVTLEGALDNTTTSILEKKLDPLLITVPASFVVLDLRKLTYLNSTGLAKLLQYHMHVKRLKQGVFRLFGLSKFIYEILDICGALKMLEVYRTQEEALTA